MSVWIWLTAAAVALGAELMLGTVYLLALAAGFACAAPVSAFAGPLWQWASVGVVTAAGALLVRRLRREDKGAADEPDAGRIVLVESVDADGCATVRYRGARWRARAARPLTPGRWTIERVDGTELVLGRRLDEGR